MSNLMNEIDELEAVETKKAGMLRQLLDEKLTASGELLVTKGEMGATVAYNSTVSFKWINDNVKLFTMLPLFQKKVDEHGNFIVDEANAADLRQRAPNWSRQLMMVEYLLRQTNRMFPPILVVVEEEWVGDLNAVEWVADQIGEKRASRDSIPFTALDSNGRVGLADYSKASMFVIDGSHRWMGINGLMDLIKNGHVELKKRDGASAKRVEKLEDIAARFDLDPALIPEMQYETMGIELIPAVVAGETREEARRRVRSVFVHVNKSAEPPTQSEQALLDEDNGFAVVGRDSAFVHQLFRRMKAGDRVNWKGTALPEGSHWLTTGMTLRDSVQAYLGHDPDFQDWKTGSPKEIAVRPPEDELEDGKALWLDYLNHLATLPSFKAILTGEEIDEWRPFSKRGHLLMRPLGQLILADAVGYLRAAVHGPQLSLDDIFDMLKVFDANQGFEGVDQPTSVWWGVTYDAQRKTMYMSGRKTAVGLMKHLLHDTSMDLDGRKELKEDYAALRTIDLGTHLTGYTWDGTEVDQASKIDLPPQI